MSEQYTRDLLGSFCSRDSFRSAISQPFTQGKYTFATDGKILIGVHKVEGMQGHEEAPADILGRFGIDENQSGFVTIPEVKRPKFEECSVCYGSGEFECNCPYCQDYHPCNYCKGSGKKRIEKEIQIGENVFSDSLLFKASQLSGFKVLPTEKGEPMHFRFLEGFGIIMPLMKGGAGE